jgi:outer membrane protein OmpA-like peptidoglycan-associated protein
VLLFIFIGLIYFTQQGCKSASKNEVSSSTEKTDTLQNSTPPSGTNVETPPVKMDSSGKKIRIELPSGVRINVEPNSVTMQILDYLKGSEPAGKCFILDNVIFSTNSADLEPISETQLSDLKFIMDAYSGMAIVITGYSDQTSDATKNKNISRSRAVAVQDWLIYRRISGDRMQSRSMSDPDPNKSGDQKGDQAMNTRPEVCIVNKG